MTIETLVRLVKGMKLNQIQIESLARAVVHELHSQGIAELKAKEEVVLAKAVSFLKEDFAREVELEKEVNKMLDELERKNPGEFERYKMYPMLKKKMAQQKGVIL